MHAYSENMPRLHKELGIEDKVAITLKHVVSPDWLTIPIKITTHHPFQWKFKDPWGGILCGQVKRNELDGFGIKTHLDGRQSQG